MKTNIYIVFIIIVLSACSKKEQNNNVSKITPVNIAVGIGKVVPQGGISKLAAPTSGIVSSINVAVGEQVKSGDVLLVLDSKDASLALDDIKNRYVTQQKSVQSASMKVDIQKNKLRDIERRLQDYRHLLSLGSVTEESVRLLDNEYNLEKQEAELLQNDVVVQESILKEIGTQLRISEEDYNKTSLCAPMDGIVLDIIPRKGEALSLYDTYLLLAPNAPLVVTAEIDEMFSSKIKVGQNCEIFFSGDSNPVSKGNIISISPDLKQKSLFSDSGQDFQDRRIREIEISLDDKSDLLIDTKVECIVQLN